MLSVLKEVGIEGIAKVYVARLTDRPNTPCIEFAESLQPNLPLQKKWVLIISTMIGCPVHCLMCDAGSHYFGKLTAEEMLAQIDYMISRRFPKKKVAVEKLKVQFTRMGEPAFNMAVLGVLEQLPKIYDAPGLIPAVSTIAPANCEKFFEGLLNTKQEFYSKGNFQLQFSIHTTDAGKRDRLIPTKKLDFKEIADYGEKFFAKGDRKITLNFALIDGFPIDPPVLTKYFSPKVFLIKITPLNPTTLVAKNNLGSVKISSGDSKVSELTKELQLCGYDVIISVGADEENQIGSNCGQFLSFPNKAAIEPTLQNKNPETITSAQ